MAHMKLTKEPEDLQDGLALLERCVFCNISTDMWHLPTNNPVCEECSKKHKVSELKNWKKKGKK